MPAGSPEDHTSDAASLIQSLMRRQDDAILELDELNDRVEQLIAEITGRTEDGEVEPVTDEAESPTEMPVPSRRAA